MRLSRLVPVLAAGALFAASTSPAQAQTEPVEGVGTTVGELTLLSLDAGNLLSLDLLSDAGLANTDDATGPSRAAAQIAALALQTAATAPVSVPVLSVSSTGEPQRASQEVALPANPLVSGTALPLTLVALVDEAGARSDLAAALGDLDVLGGILGLEGTQVDLGSTALPGDAAGDRSIDVDTLTMLDLEALLAALGIPLTDLPLDTLLGLLEGLGLLGQLGLGDLSVEEISALVDDLLTEVDTLEASIVQVRALMAEIASLEELQQSLQADTSTCDSLGDLDDLLTGDETLTELCADIETTLASLEAQITALQAELAALEDLDTLLALLDGVLAELEAVLSAPLDLLSGQALLRLDGVDVTVLTKATDDVATSVADVTGTLGALQVGALPALGGLDLGATTDQLNGLLAQAEGVVGGVLEQVAPGLGLADLVSIRTLQETTSITEEAGQVTSSAAFTGLQVDVLPALVDVDAVLASLGGTDSVGAVLGDLGLPVPASGATEVHQLNSLLAPVTGASSLLGALSLLEEGLGMQLATLSQQSTFTPVAVQAPVAPGTPSAPAAPTAPAAPAAPSPVLPRTGSDDGMLLALAGAAVLAALGGRHLVRRSTSGSR